MAITGKAVIAPANTVSGVRHIMSDIRVEVPSGQDGIWSAPASGARVDNIQVDGGDGTNKFGIRIGATGVASYGIYSNLAAVSAQHGLEILNTNTTIINGVLIRTCARHGIYLSGSDYNKISDVLIRGASWGNSGVYDGIRADNSDANMFDGILFPTNLTTFMKSTFNFVGSVDNAVGDAAIDPGLTNVFLETTYLDNDFGLNMTTWSFPGVIATATGALRLPFGTDCEMYAVEARLDTAPTGSAVIVDMHKNGSTIFTTPADRPTLAIASRSDTGLPNVTAVAAADYMTVDIDQKDSNDVASDLTVTARWRRT